MRPGSLACGSLNPLGVLLCQVILRLRFGIERFWMKGWFTIFVKSTLLETSQERFTC